MLISPDKLADVMKTYEVTRELLDGLKALGFKFKRLALFDFEPGTGYPRWTGIGEEDGIIQFPGSADAHSVAHEMGHGFYECLSRDYVLPQQFLTPNSGEDFAEAIRWWVEQRLGPSQWQPQHLMVLDTFNRSFDVFKNWLRTLNRKQTSQPATGAAPTAPVSPRPSPGTP
jgi:hypothetical protein